MRRQRRLNIAHLVSLHQIRQLMSTANSTALGGATLSRGKTAFRFHFPSTDLNVASPPFKERIASARTGCTRACRDKTGRWASASNFAVVGNHDKSPRPPDDGARVPNWCALKPCSSHQIPRAFFLSVWIQFVSDRLGIKDSTRSVQSLVTAGMPIATSSMHGTVIRNFPPGLP